ncbi:ABC transporter ATP-binding protein [bacterium]|nr:MAG: ABC transporter ATP-binding protein [bacterium]
MTIHAKTPLLRIENLSKQFPQVTANDRVSLEIERGEIHCLLGENGAGKTTLAECLYGFFIPDSGKIYFKGKEVRFSSPYDAIRLGIGMVHQHFVLVPPLSVIENIVAGTPSLRAFLDFSEAISRVKRLCDEYGIDIDPWAKIWQLSVGEQQWVEILKALYVGLELLILDEPTAVLTPQETEKLFSILRKMKADGISIIFITHKLGEVMQVSDRVTVLRKGLLVDTVNTSQVSKADLALMMVGREVVFHVKKEKLEPGEPVLEVGEVYAQNDRGQEALKGISLTLHHNEILGIAGVSGNGQKELFEVIIGVRKPSRGHIRADGKEITGLPPKEVIRHGIVHVPEDRIKEGLIAEFTVEENMILGLQRERRFRRWSFLDARAIRLFSRQCIEAFEIATPSSVQITKTLSGGSLQKVILARELSQQPRCLIANQPTRGLDVGATEYVHRRLLEQRKNGVGVLLISDDLEEIFNLADRIAVMFKGKIMGLFKAEEASLEAVGLLMAGVKEGIA